MKYRLILIALLLPLFLHAQDETYRTVPVADEALPPGELPQASVYLVPFQKRLFQCHFMRTISKANGGMTQPELSDSVMVQLFQAIGSEMMAWEQESLDAFALPERTRTGQWERFHSSLSYAYAPIPAPEEEESKWKKLKKPLKRKEPEPQPTGTRIENGQLVSRTDENPKYLHATPKENGMLQAVHSFHGSQWIVLINQVEISLPKQISQEAIQSEQFQREWRIHFSIYQANGSSLGGGMAVAYSGYHTDAWPAIRNSGVFEELAKQVVHQTARFAQWEAPVVEEK